LRDKFPDSLTRIVVDRDSFKLSFRTVNQAGFQLKESGIKAENKLEISSITGWR